MVGGHWGGGRSLKAVDSAVNRASDSPGAYLHQSDSRSIKGILNAIKGAMFRVAALGLSREPLDLITA